jgi:hypothetical protein
VAYDRASSACEERRDLAGTACHRTVTDGVDPPVDRMEAAAPDPPIDPMAIEPGRPELRTADDAGLPGGNRRDHLIGRFVVDNRNLG